MKKFKLTKVIAGSLVVASVLALNPIGASAEWKQDSDGWLYSEGNSYAEGWREIDGKYYYFYPDGYMAKATTIDGYYVGADGAWITNKATKEKIRGTWESNSNNGADSSLMITDIAFGNTYYGIHSYVVTDESGDSVAIDVNDNGVIRYLIKVVDDNNIIIYIYKNNSGYTEIGKYRKAETTQSDTNYVIGRTYS